MHATSRHVGDSLVRCELRVDTCEPGAEPMSTSSRDLKLGQSRLPQLLAMAARPSTDAPLASRVGPRFYRLVAGSRGRTVCRADVCQT